MLTTNPGRYHSQIRAEVARLTGMVDDLFELSRIQAGTLQLSPDRIVLGDLVSDAVASTEALADQVAEDNAVGDSCKVPA